MADIILILDESGSMDSQSKTMINNVNEMISEQKKLLAKTELPPERISMHIYRFSSTVKSPISAPLMSFPKFTDQDYDPCGMTALYDAIGTVLQRFRDSKNKTVLVIATDGEENSSKEYTLEAIQTKLKAKQECGWSIVYLSETLATKQQGACLGVKNNHNVSTGPQSLHKMMRNTHLNNAIHFACMDGGEREFESAITRCHGNKNM